MKVTNRNLPVLRSIPCQGFGTQVTHCHYFYLNECISPVPPPSKKKQKQKKKEKKSQTERNAKVGGEGKGTPKSITGYFLQCGRSSSGNPSLESLWSLQQCTKGGVALLMHSDF